MKTNKTIRKTNDFVGMKFYLQKLWKWVMREFTLILMCYLTFIR